MPTPDPIPYISDSLSDAARKERKHLLVASAISLLFSLAGLVPKEISFLGINLAEPGQKQLTYIMASVIFYFLLAFMFYGIADILIWIKKRHDYRCSTHSEPEDYDQYANISLTDEQYVDIPIIYWKIIPLIAGARMVFDFLVPLLIGIFSIIELFYFRSHLSKIV